MALLNSDPEIFINYEPTEEDVRTMRNNWNRIKIGETWFSGYGTFKKTATGFKLDSVTENVPNRIIATFIFRFKLVCEAAGYDINTTINEQ